MEENEFTFKNKTAEKIGDYLFKDEKIPEPESLVLDWLFSKNGPVLLYNFFNGIDTLRKTGYANMDVKHWYNRVSKKASPQIPDEVINDAILEDIKKIYAVLCDTPRIFSNEWKEFNEDLKKESVDHIAAFLTYMYDRVPYEIDMEPFIKYIEKRNVEGING